MRTPAFRRVAARFVLPTLATVAIVAALAWPIPPSAAAVEELPAPSPDAPRVIVSPTMRQPAIPLPDDVRELLRKRDWKAAADALLELDPKSFVGPEKGDWAFVTAWALSHAGRAAEAKPYLPLIDGADCVPPGYAALIKAEVHRALGEHQVALGWLEQVDPDTAAGPRAAVQRAEVLRGLGRTKEAWAIYEQLAAQPDPSPGVPIALLVLADRAGKGSPEAYPLLRRLWSQYPRTEEAVAATQRLAAYPADAAHAATWQQVAQRAERLMDRGEWSAAVLETDRVLSQVTGDDADACRFVLVRGRSLYKLNKLGDSIRAFGDVGARCKNAGDEGDYGAKALYLQGQAYYRTGDYAASAATSRKIADLWPNSTFADDGLTQAGIALQEAGDLEGAKHLWMRALTEQPSGDTVPESTFRLAFALYLDGKPDEARDVAKKLGALPLAGDAVHVAAGRYWAARLAMYPNRAAPHVPTADPARRKEAIDGWAALCRDMPHSFYAILAWARLREVAPDVAAELAGRASRADTGDLTKPWAVRLAFVDHPSIRAGVELARLGLVQEARAEWDRVGEDKLTPDEMAWLTELRIAAGDWLLAHDDMRQWMKSHPPGTLGEREAQVLRVAYPDRYWDVVREHASAYRYEPRLLHALIREESNFNKDISSHVGARGLTQLMPATARETAGWLKISVATSELGDPDKNVMIGARYLDAMIGQHKGSPYLALAAYNAGGGRVKQWLAEYGNVPTDEYVEHIPIRETRGYVKRVMGTWQTYRWQFDDGPAFYDLSAFNHKALRD